MIRIANAVVFVSEYEGVMVVSARRKLNALSALGEFWIRFDGWPKVPELGNAIITCRKRCGTFTSNEEIREYDADKLICRRYFADLGLKTSSWLTYYRRVDDVAVNFLDGSAELDLMPAGYSGRVAPERMTVTDLSPEGLDRAVREAFDRIRNPLGP